MAARPQKFTVTFSASGSVSTALQIGHLDARGYGVAIPSAWTAAKVGFEVSDDGTTYVRLMDTYGGTAAAITDIGTRVPGSRGSVDHRRLQVRAIGVNQHGVRSLRQPGGGAHSSDHHDVVSA